MNKLMNKLIIFVLFSFTCLPISADIYLYIDEMGDQHFSEHKETSKYKLLLRSKTNHTTQSFKNWKEKTYRYVTLPRNNNLQEKYHPLVMRAAQTHQLEPAFIHAVITAESAYQHKAVSSAGAQGLMQLMPMTAKRFGVRDSFDPYQNINAGSLYLKKLLAEFHSKELALAAYNAGEGTVRKYNNQIPPYPETQRYVKKVMKFYIYG